MTQNQTAQTKKGKKKLPLAILAGAVIGGAFILIKDPQERRRLKQKTSQTKDTVSQYTSEVKEDPSGKKDEVLDRVRRTATVIKDVFSTVQEIIDNEGKELKQQAQTIKDDSQDMLSTAQDVKEDLKEVGDKTAEAKEELTTSSEEKEEAHEPGTIRR
ncbi:hypothetical protein MUN89_03405 [Halobacillus salinarum]|uniref:Gas vesicle protein n=1 Tax=Halobacillus salinarum TaxID=2932257 RepID=A0ABY4ELK8_9BACI|nr:hypothetical protein [Halobacillus salinarum]UOQ45013.1 hypothetical protein MUN89_03405 [Halobacillus salinarum]